MHHLMERVAIEAIRVSRGFAGNDPQRRGKAGYVGEVPGTLDHNAFRLRQRPRQAFGMIPHARQVIVLRSIEKHGNRALRQRIVGEWRRVRRHEHNGADPRIAKIGEVGDLWRDIGERRHSLRGPMDSLERLLTEDDWKEALAATTRRPVSRKR